VTAPREVATAAAAAAAILLFNTAYVSSQVGFLHSAKDVAEFDHHIYRSLAQSPPGSPEPPGHRNAPFVWRVATPWLAYGLQRAGLGIDASSYAVTNAALFGFLVVLYGLLRRRGFEREEALLGLVLVGLIQGAIRWYEYQYWMADPVALFLIALSLWLVETGRTGWLVTVGAVGVAARESYLMVFAFLFVRTLRSEGLLPAIGRTAAISCLPLLVLVSIRLLVDTTGPYTALDTVAWVIEARLQTLFTDQLYWASVGTFGVVFPLLLLFPDALWRDWRSRPEDAALVAIVYASLAIAISTDRILAYALPVLIPAALAQLRRFRQLTGVGTPAAVAACIGLQLFFFSQIQFTGMPAVSVRQPPSLWVTLAMVGFWFGARGWARRASRS
jgi:hypothetical protein